MKIADLVSNFKRSYKRKMYDAKVRKVYKWVVKQKYDPANNPHQRDSKDLRECRTRLQNGQCPIRHDNYNREFNTPSKWCNFHELERRKDHNNYHLTRYVDKNNRVFYTKIRKYRKLPPILRAAVECVLRMIYVTKYMYGSNDGHMHRFHHLRQIYSDDPFESYTIMGHIAFTLTVLEKSIKIIRNPKRSIEDVEAELEQKQRISDEQDEANRKFLDQHEQQAELFNLGLQFIQGEFKTRVLAMRTYVYPENDNYYDMSVDENADDDAVSSDWSVDQQE